MSVPEDRLDLTAGELPLPPMQPRKILGREIAGPSIGVPVAKPRGAIGAAGANMGFEARLAASRWTRIGEVFDEAIDQEQFFDIVGERDVDFEPGITAAEAERRAMQFDFRQQEAQYEGHPIAGFVGGTVGALIDPVNILTIPFGGANFRAAKEATSFFPFLRQSAMGGGKAGAASLPIELFFQQSDFGEFDAGRAAGSAIGPVVAAPLLQGLARGIGAGFNRIRNGPDTVAASRNVGTDPTIHPLEKLRIIDEAESAGLPPPLIFERTAPPPIPRQRLRDTFNDYRGGWRGFVQDLAAGRSSAAVKARALNIDPEDNEVVQRLVDALSARSDQTAATPVDYNIRLTDTLNQFRAGEVLDPGQVRILQDNGLVAPLIRAGAAEGAEPELTLTSVGRRIADALDNPTAPGSRELLDGVSQRGAGEARQAIRNAQARGEPVSADDFDSLPRIISEDSIDELTVIQHLEAASRRSRVPDTAPPPRETTPVRADEPPEPVARGEGEQAADTAPEPQVSEAVQRARRQVREAGANPDDVQAAVKALFDGVRTCGL